LESINIFILENTSWLIMLNFKLDPEVEVNYGEGQVTVKGPKGILVKKMDGIRLHVENGKVYLWAITEPHLENAYLSLLQQLVIGVTKGYKQKLKLVGVGYRASLLENKLILKLGYSHEVKYAIPHDITITPSKNKGVLLLIQGVELDRVQQVAVEIRRFREPDAYKGKGIHYYGEILRLKKGKREGK